MCGIAGFISPEGFSEAEASLLANRMGHCLVHRGPDDAGIWLDPEVGIALTHRRLSILDLSPAGRQPMLSSSGRYVLVFNGEIYNHQEVRRKAEGAGHRAWRGRSDTETLLAVIELWGLEKALRESVGMFALALWDRKERRLFLARDRMGEKPLYYGQQGKHLLFASEPKALRIHPAFQGQIDPDAIGLYLRRGYIPAPWSIWQGIRKLPPGCIASFDMDTLFTLHEPRPYWSLGDVIAAAGSTTFQGSEGEAIDLLDNALKKAIAGQMIADVPLGAFLSGGIDSSTVVALMQAQSSRPVKTFTIGFDENGYNEALHAMTVATHLGTDHTELYLTANETQDVIPKLPYIYDEPFGDASAIPTHLVATLARQKVTVALSGDGGDELLGGYDRYVLVNRRWQQFGTLPTFLRKIATKTLRIFGRRSLDHLYWSLGARKNASLAARMQIWADYLESVSEDALYDRSITYWPELVNRNVSTIPSFVCPIAAIERMMAADSVMYLPDDILVKVDRAAMAVGLETRVPLLDHRVVELAWRMPFHFKVRQNQGKWLLRQVLYRYVPRTIVDRPKMGFAVPVDEWVRGPLRDWAEELLDPHRIKEQGFFDPVPIRIRWQDHLQGHHNWRDSLWLVLMLQAWLHVHANGL